MSRVKQYIRLPITPLLKRVKLPLTRRTVPVWAIVLFVLVVVFPAGGAAVVLSNQPIFCSSCHEMGLHYDTWRQSAHSEVTCEECHLMPGTVNMFKTKLNALRQVRAHAKGDVQTAIIQGHVPDENCRGCHPETPELVAYHGLKITHKDHWNMGVACTYCHERVVHGPKWLYTGVTSTERVVAVTTPRTFSPTMETCYTCHDGKQAPNECSTCHVSLGVRKPTAFDPAWVEAHRAEVRRTGEADCQRCHLDTFCANCHRAADPHSSDWIARHPKETRQSPESCAVCHLAPAERQPADVEKMAFCSACHELRREHKQADWQQVHGRESLANPANCQQCHTQDWCASCHSISRPHRPEWTARHSAEANRSPEGCQVCHTERFCESCHQSEEGIPSSHASSWLTRHRFQAQAGDESCRTCHRDEFCQRCHAQKAPESHGKLWVRQHGTASEARPAACLLCHKESQCNECHGMSMPHPTLWLASHQKAGDENRELCDRCHRTESCDTCHRGAFPASHQASNWTDVHGVEAKKSMMDCRLCHRMAICTSCHGVQMPHVTGWGKEAHGEAAEKSKTVCLRCHGEDECTECHGLALPHPDTWSADHGTQATAEPQACVRCHEPGGQQCSMCHAAIAPSDHGTEGWAEEHATAGAANLELCSLCHGEKACVDCHEKRRE
jgi:nitrate/TMAO reductase-like tetraheme cytochrome c subunit